MSADAQYLEVTMRSVVALAVGAVFLGQGLVVLAVVGMDSPLRASAWSAMFLAFGVVWGGAGFALRTDGSWRRMFRLVVNFSDPPLDEWDDRGEPE